MSVASIFPAERCRAQIGSRPHGHMEGRDAVIIIEALRRRAVGRAPGYCMKPPIAIHKAPLSPCRGGVPVWVILDRPGRDHMTVSSAALPKRTQIQSIECRRRDIAMSRYT